MAGIAERRGHLREVEPPAAPGSQSTRSDRPKGYQLAPEERHHLNKQVSYGGVGGVCGSKANCHAYTFSFPVEQSRSLREDTPRVFRLPYLINEWEIPVIVCSELRLSVLRQVSNDKGEEEICAIGAGLFIQSTFLMPNSLS